jgi:hypothetical protein
MELQASFFLQGCSAAQGVNISKAHAVIVPAVAAVMREYFSVNCTNLFTRLFGVFADSRYAEVRRHFANMNLLLTGAPRRARPSEGLFAPSNGSSLTPSPSTRTQGN